MSTAEETKWTSLLESDITEVDKIAREIHPTLPERWEVFAEKLRLFPAGCFKFMFEGKMVGYTFSHPWTLYSIPPLDDFLHTLPENPDCIYIHDVAVLPAARGHNAAGLFIAQISKVAQKVQIQHLACVSVYGTDVLWARLGFRVVSSEEIASKLGSYGDSAKYMVADGKV
ncbi:MAG TPA: GNAT family N-acetyltransferase [Candidatus Paceibacterota bacterium]